MLTFENDLNNFMRSGIQHRKVFVSYKAAFQTWHGRDHLDYNWELDQLENEVKSNLLSRGLILIKVDHLIYLMQDPRIMTYEEEELEKVISPRDITSVVIAVIGGTLYAIVRIVLLALAFAALRSVPDGVYTTTWTRFLPNIA